LARRNAAVKTAEQKRDNALYKYLTILYELNLELKKMGRVKALKALEARYGDKLPTAKNSHHMLLKLTYPDLSASSRNTRFRYAKILRYVLRKKNSSETVKSFVRGNGGINRCIRKEKKLRD
jgi:hypothetical protein